MTKGGTAKPTLVSLARDLGVSRQTVSNALNAPQMLKSETRERVLAAIRASGYRPSVVGRALRTQRSMNLGFRLFPAVDGINGQVMDRFLHNLTLQAQQHGYRLTLFASDSYADEVEALIEQHRGGVIDGCVLTNTHDEDLRPHLLSAAGVPTVAFGRPWGESDAKHAWLDIDGASGCRAAVRHLRDAGHTKIGFLGWPLGPGVGDDRRDGWLQGMAGLATDGLQVEVEDGARHGSQGADELLANGATAIVCASDSLALGALTSLSRQGHAALPVFGFDDTPIAAAIGLSSIAQPVEEAAERLISMALAELRGGEPGQRQVLLAPRLVIRSPETFIS